MKQPQTQRSRALSQSRLFESASAGAPPLAWKFQKRDAISIAGNQTCSAKRGRLDEKSMKNTAANRASKTLGKDNDIGGRAEPCSRFLILASAKKKNYFNVARIWSHAGRMANDEIIPNSTLASINQ
jgi:hypothetical protein